MNGRTAKALRRLVNGDAPFPLPTYEYRSVIKHLPTGELHPDGTPVIAPVKRWNVRLKAGTPRALYQRAKALRRLVARRGLA